MLANLESWQLLIVFFLPILVFLAMGLPIAFVLGGMAVFLTIFFLGPHALTMIVYTAIAETSSFVLLAVPLFILMSNVLRLTAIADDLYGAAYMWFGRVGGGLAIGTVIICAIFAAMAGISGVATVSMGLIALPSMLERGYDKEMAIGCIAAGGALGILIPPSVIMILYAVLCNESVGQMFVGGILPGILLTAIFIAYIGIRCVINPSLGPPTKEAYSMRQKMVALKGIALPALLIFLVLGTMYTGICTPTESAAVGAAGAFACAATQKRLNLKNMHKSLLDTTKLSAMIFWIVIGAVSFSHVYAVSGVTEWLTKALIGIEVNRWVVMGMMQFTFFILGMLLDPAGIIMICTPIFVPIVEALGFDKLWFGILFVVNMEMAYITPPFGFNLFYMRGIVPPGITMADIYRSIVPYVGCQALCLIICMIFPDIATWLPRTMVAK